jgi:hypothetical protein
MLRTAKLVLLSTVLLTCLSSIDAQTAKCEPHIDVSALLTNVDVNGSLQMSKFYARCLPMPARKSSSAYEYHPYDGGKFSSTLKSSSGQAINTFVWYGENIQSLWEMSRYEVIGGSQAIKKLEPGKYVLEFAVEDKVFQTFPFTVATKESSDQFRPETLYTLDGAWRDYAQLYAPNVDRFFQLNVWLRKDDPVADPKPVSLPVTMKLIREGDKTIVGESDARESVSLTHKWRSYSLSFRRPGAEQAKDYSEFKLNDILATDGKYRIELAVEGRPKVNYVFNVKGGRINGLDLAVMRKENYRIIIPLSRVP